LVCKIQKREGKHRGGVVAHAPNIRMTSFADDATENQKTDAGRPMEMNRHPNIMASPILLDRCL